MIWKMYTINTKLYNVNAVLEKNWVNSHRHEPTKSREYCLTPVFESKGLNIDVSKTNEMIIID